MKELTYESESRVLCSEAFFSKNTKGRLRATAPCPFRTEFQRDRDRITHSKSFRRLMYKTQVFPFPMDDHSRTRLTHTIEVSQIARTIARAMRLNEDLTEAAAMGHDLGHTPFGHLGEDALNTLSPYGFKHYEQSLRVADKLENDGLGLNLTLEVRDAILNHAGDMLAETLEGRIIKFSDRIAYINHDIDDAIRAGVIRLEDIPKEFIEIFGNTHSLRIATMVSAVIENGTENGIGMKEPYASAMQDLRKFMFENVYRIPVAINEGKKIFTTIERIYCYYIKNVDALPDEYKATIETDGLERSVCDYIACMTDRYAIHLYETLFMPKTWPINN